jgi:hypothetical protein
MHLSWRSALIWMLKANLVVWAFNAIIFGIFYFSHVAFSAANYFTLITLLESGISLLIGGAIAVSGSALTRKVLEQPGKPNEPWSVEKLKKSEKKANKYLILAAVLFVQCLIISFI